MPLLLSDAIADMTNWTLGPPKSKNGQMTISSITGKGGWPSVKLLPRERLGEIYTPFEPSVFRGTGTEPRKGIVFAVPPDVLDDLQKIEDWARKQTSSLSAVWHSAIKEPGTFWPQRLLGRRPGWEAEAVARELESPAGHPDH